MQITNLLINEPSGKDYHNKNLIKIYKKDFLQKLSMDINYEKLLIDVLDNKVMSYDQRLYYIPFYMPIKNLKQYEENNLIEIEYFDLKNNSKRLTRVDMFINFIEWLETKEINYNYVDNHLTLMEKLINRLIEWNDKKLNSWFLNNGFIISKIEKLNDLEKINLFNTILDNWDNIWNKDNQQELRSHFIYSKFNDPYPLFQTLECLSKQLELTKIYPYHANYDKFINNIKEFEEFTPIARNIIDLQFNIFLNSILVNKKSKKSKKI